MHIGLPKELVCKTPIDGLKTNEDGSYMTDEQSLGVTYDEIHSYIRNDKEIDKNKFEMISNMEEKSKFKLEPIPAFMPTYYDLYKN